MRSSWARWLTGAQKVWAGLARGPTQPVNRGLEDSRWGRLAGVVADREGRVGSGQLVGPVARHVGLAVLKLDLLFLIDDDRPVVELISNGDVTVGKLDGVR